MAEGPLVDEFMRHLQASLDEAMEIEDKIERHDRILQLEIAIQEAIIFKNRYQELVSHGIDPLVLVSHTQPYNFLISKMLLLLLLLLKLLLLCEIFSQNKKIVTASDNSVQVFTFPEVDANVLSFLVK